MEEKILILDFGSQYTQLIARRVRELNIYCEIFPYNKAPKNIKNFKGLILSGSPFSVHDAEAPSINLEEFENIPILGICYGAQMVAKISGCNVLKSEIREYGRAKLNYVNNSSLILDGVKSNSDVWMSHGDSIKNNKDVLEVIASTDDVEVASYYIKKINFYGLQFHPEVTHSAEGKKILENFTVKICGCNKKWTPDKFVEQTVRELKEKLGKERVILGLSGGVDSSVAAFLIHRAIGKNLFCVFVDNGLLRKNEFQDVLDSYRNFGLNVVGTNSKEIFYSENIDDNDWDKIHQSMIGVIENPKGTAGSLRDLKDYVIAAKSGTVELVSTETKEDYKIIREVEGKRDHAIIIAFGPMPNPKYAISVVIENGESGGSVAGPVAIEVLNTLIKND